MYLISVFIFVLLAFDLSTAVKADEISSDFDESKEDPICPVCRNIATEVLRLHSAGANKSTLRDTTISLCVNYKLSTPTVCVGLVDVLIDIAMYIADRRPLLVADTVCGVLLQAKRCRFLDVYGTFEWSVDIDETNASPATDSKWSRPEDDENGADDDLTIVHITDLHYDPQYLEGSLAACPDPQCCRYFNKIDYIYITGDIVDHAIWSTSFEHNANTIKTTYAAIHRIFGDIPILPVIGNHEPHPLNQIAPSDAVLSDLDSSRMYKLLAKSWRHWLTPEAALSVRQFGYYTQLLRAGLRVIALNNTDGSTINLWLLYDARFAMLQLQWLHDTLLAAEAAGEKVHLLVHYPNGSEDLLRTYSREYQRIVERFWDTISAQFNGHTHTDQFYVFYDRRTASRALNVAWNGGGANTFVNLNPNYRLYSVESQTYQVRDHETWTFNLTEANEFPNESPIWFREYTFRDAYDVADLSPGTLDTLLTRMSHEPELLEQYWRYMVKEADPALAAGCDRKCLAGELCNLANTMVQPNRENARCVRLVNNFWKVVGNE